MLSRKKIRFIEPQGRHSRPLNVWITRWPLVGPITLATILDNRGYDVRIFNENISGLVDSDPVVYDDLKSADVVCLTIMTSTAGRGYDIAAKLREDGFTGKIAMGGVHATMVPEEVIQHADIVCRGEGERMIEAIAAGEVEDGIHEGEPVEDLDELPALNHFLIHRFQEDLLDHCYRNELYELPAMTSRGCPYGCVYCSVTRMFGRRVRQQSVQKVADDLKVYTGRGFNQLFYYDDNFTSNRPWLKNLLRRIAPMNVRFNTQSRIDFMWEDASRTRLDKDLMRLMRRGGAQSLYIGYETIDEATAKGWKKGYQKGDVSLAERLATDTKLIVENGIWIHGMFVVGPQHKQTHVDGILEFGQRNKINSIQLSCLTPFPGTPLFDEYRPHLLFRKFPGDWDFFDGTHCLYDHSHLGIENFQDVLFDAHRRFYRTNLNGRSFRAVLSRKMSFTSKLLEMLQTSRLSGRAMKGWRVEIEVFRKIIQERKAEREQAKRDGTYVAAADTKVVTVDV